MPAELRRTRLPAAGVSLSCLEAGPESGPLVILLHGFPENAQSWRPQILALAEAGRRVLAPDQRGYVASDKPRSLKAYRTDILAKDIVALADRLGRDRFDLVGHDWGGVVAWGVAAEYPDRVRRLAILNAPHPGAMARYVLRSPSQLRNSSYIAAFQVPLWPEVFLGRRGFRRLAGALVGTSRPGTFSEADLELYRQGWSQPGALTAMLNWYRALRLPQFGPASTRITAPTLVLWGMGDRFLERGLAQASLDFCEDGRVEWFTDATHWLHHEEAERVSRELVRFLRG